MKMATILLIAAAAVLLPTPSSAACKDDLTVCKDINFYGYKGDGCDLKEETTGATADIAKCCAFCTKFGSKCTGFTLDAKKGGGWSCWLKQVDRCTPRAVTATYQKSYTMKGVALPTFCPKVKATNCVGAWGAWTACSKACDAGTQDAYYTHTTSAKNGGKACTTKVGVKKSQACTIRSCSVTCKANFKAVTRYGVAKCEACPAGSTSKAGVDIKVCTKGKPVTCKENQYANLVTRTCVACDNGWTSKAGDDVTKCTQDSCAASLQLCSKINFYGYKGDGCDLKEEVTGKTPDLAKCCAFCTKFGSKCTGFTLDAKKGGGWSCWLKQVDRCTPRAVTATYQKSYTMSTVSQPTYCPTPPPAPPRPRPVPAPTPGPTRPGPAPAPDMCKDQPCKNGATCTSGTAGAQVTCTDAAKPATCFSCACAGGWSGNMCANQSASCRDLEWVDEDTPYLACSTQTFGKDGRGNAEDWELVMSDEFEQDGRNFYDGNDPKWAALDLNPYTNLQRNYYNETYATTGGGMLRLKTTASKVTKPYVDAKTGQNKTFTQNYQTSMIQSWNKFCFQGGVWELSAKLPGRASQPGLWPAAWMMGNLGRAVFPQSTFRTWPFNFNKCPKKGEEAATWGKTAVYDRDSHTHSHSVTDSPQQLFSACDKLEGDMAKIGMNNYQGRGADEIDIIEAMPGRYCFGYEEDKVDKMPTVGCGTSCHLCKNRSRFELDNLRTCRPFLASSLQLAPGFPVGSDQRPNETVVEVIDERPYINGVNCLPDEGQWYEELLPGKPCYGSSSSPNYEFRGERFHDKDLAYDVQTDAMSANTNLEAYTFESQHVYRLEMELPKTRADGTIDNGFLRFTLDGRLNFYLDGDIVAKDRKVSFDGVDAGMLPGREIPLEPQYMIFNTDISERWGWPECYPNKTIVSIPGHPYYGLRTTASGSAIGKPACDCCQDCTDPKCYHCLMPDIDVDTGTWRNSRSWLKEFCDMLPADYQIDYVRMYQRKGEEHKITCNPPSHPTKGFINSRKRDFMVGQMEAPLRFVKPGGAPCNEDKQCSKTCDKMKKTLAREGATIPCVERVTGSCVATNSTSGGVEKTCKCKDGYVGPNCRVEAAGPSKYCPKILGPTNASVADPTCLAPSKAPYQEIEQMIKLQCSFTKSEGAADSPALAGLRRACFLVDEILGEYSECDPYDRLNYVLMEWRKLTGRCCNRRGGLPCTDDDISEGLIAFFVASALVLAIGIKFHRAVKLTKNDAVKRMSSSHLLGAISPGAKMKLRSWKGSMKKIKESKLRPATGVKALKNADLCESTDEVDALILEVMQSMESMFGFQEDSVNCQAEHLSSLWRSTAAHVKKSKFEDQAGPAGAALLSLRQELLRSANMWNGKMTGDYCDQKVTLTRALEDVCLFLLVWGEAGNVRFMPELLDFLYHAAREAYAAHIHEATPIYTNHNTRPGDFLALIIRPIYNCAFSQTFKGMGSNGRPMSKYEGIVPPDAINYDDINEIFWDVRKMGLIIVASADASSHSQLLDIDEQANTFKWAPKSKDQPLVFSLLPSVNWEDSVKDCKSHREVRGVGTVLFASFSRVWELHVLLFTLLALYEFGSTPAHWDVWPLPMIGISLLAQACSHSVTIKQFSAGSTHLSSALKVCVCAVPVLAALLLPDEEGAVDGPTDWSAPRLVHHVWSAVLVIGLAGWHPGNGKSEETHFDLFMYLRSGETWLLNVGAFFFWVFVFAIKSSFAHYVLLESGKEANLALSNMNGVTVMDDWLSRASLDWLTCYISIWVPIFFSWVTDTQLFTMVVIAIFGGLKGFSKFGFRAAIWGAESGKGLHLSGFPKLFSDSLDLKPDSAPEPESGTSSVSLNDLEPGRLAGFSAIWDELMRDMFKTDLINSEELGQLSFCDAADDLMQTSSMVNVSIETGGYARTPEIFSQDHSVAAAALPHNHEARRRIRFLARSMQVLAPTPYDVARLPGFSVLVPHYGETILVAKQELMKDHLEVDTDHKSTTLIAFLVQYFAMEFETFVGRVHSTKDLAGSEAGLPTRRGTMKGHLDGNLELQLRIWSSRRMQTLWRTVEGMSLYHRALDMLMVVQHPNMSKEAREANIKSSFRLVVAMQRYAVFSDAEVEEAELLLTTLPESMAIAYIEEVHVSEEEAANRGIAFGSLRYYSSLVDASCDILPSGKRDPRVRVELPGFPILGNGKSDNQNHALIFTRGEFLQTIDANQEGYLEMALRIPAILKEFELPHDGAKHFDATKSTRRPAIIGFREHIFSNTGSLGDFAATSELVFGTMTQRVLTKPLRARMHYGHPDVMDKLQMMAQGGMSKATRGLNLSEDIFAGMDLTLRGGRVKFKEYFQVGKGRDLGFNSVLSFFAKVSSGTGEQSITRQSYRLGKRLPMSRLLGYYYAHVGYYFTQVWMYRTIKAFCFLAAFLALHETYGEGAGLVRFGRHADEAIVDENQVTIVATYGEVATIVVDTVFGPLYMAFLAMQVLPLLLVLLIEEGPMVAAKEIVVQTITLAPLFFVFQSKVIAYNFLREIALGGGGYIATGRGLATKRQGFGVLYRNYAESNIYDGAELLFFFVISLAAGPAWEFSWAWFVCMTLVFSSWMFAPWIFNPFQFSVAHTHEDRRDFWAWLASDDADGKPEASWLAWRRSRFEQRKTALKWLHLVPSCGIACALGSSILIEKLAASCLGDAALTWLGKAIVLSPLLSCLVLQLLLGMVDHADHFMTPMRSAALAFVLAIVELGVSVAILPGPVGFRTLACMFHKYLMHRVFIEFVSWASLPFLMAKRSDEKERSALHSAISRWVFSHHMVLDAGVAGCIFFVFTLLAYVPGIRTLHTLLLFRVLPATEDDRDKHEGTASVGHMLMEKDGELHHDHFDEARQSMNAGATPGASPMHGRDQKHRRSRNKTVISFLDSQQHPSTKKDDVKSRP